VRPGGILLRKGQYLFGPSSILPPTGQTTSVHDGDDGDLQVGRTITPRMQHNLDGTVTDHATGLMWVWKPHRLFPGSHPTQSNQTQTARGLWAFSTAYQVGDVVGIGTPFSTAWMGSGTAGSYYTYGGATWLCLTNTTDTPGTSAAWEFHSPYFAGPYVCITAHTSAAPPAAWAAYTAYSVGAVVDGGGGSYWQCTTAHTSTDTMQYEYWTFCMNAEAESAGWTTDSAKWVDAFPFVQDASSLTTTGVIPWTAALDAIDTLNTGEGYAGYADWRMPNLLEMLTLVNYGSNPLALYVPFTLPGVGYLTTATTAVAATSAAFAMDTAYGTATTRSYSEPSYLWLVRGGR
jgi:hypothetical protein